MIIQINNILDSLSSGTVIGIIGVFIGVAGFLYAIYEGRERKKLKLVIKEQYMQIFQRLRYIVLGRRKVRKFIDELGENATFDLQHFLWTKYQAISDLYVYMVGFFLSNEKKFTYNDLARFTHNEFIDTVWKERIWRQLICNRPENRGKDPEKDIPEFYYQRKEDLSVNKQLNYTCIFVKDIVRAKNFYNKLFGKSIFTENDQQFYGVLNFKNLKLFLILQSKEESENNQSLIEIKFENLNELLSGLNELKKDNAGFEFVLNQEKDNIVIKFEDCENNDVEIYCSISKI